MSTVTFDTFDFTRKLRDAGFDEKQAETVEGRKKEVRPLFQDPCFTPES